MQIICETIKNVDLPDSIVCDFSGQFPEYLELISTPTGDFYFSNTITTTDVILVFFFIFVIMYLIIKSLYRLIFSKLTYIKSKNYD
jgi:hypothetical protein